MKSVQIAIVGAVAGVIGLAGCANTSNEVAPAPSASASQSAAEPAPTATASSSGSVNSNSATFPFSVFNGSDKDVRVSFKVDESSPYCVYPDRPGTNTNLSSFPSKLPPNATHLGTVEFKEAQFTPCSNMTDSKKHYFMIVLQSSDEKSYEYKIQSLGKGIFTEFNMNKSGRKAIEQLPLGAYYPLTYSDPNQDGDASFIIRRKS